MSREAQGIESTPELFFEGGGLFPFKIYADFPCIHLTGVGFLWEIFFLPIILHYQPTLTFL